MPTARFMWAMTVGCQAPVDMALGASQGWRILLYELWWNVTLLI